MRRLLILAAALIVTLFGSLFWLTQTESGLRRVGLFAESLLDGRLSIEEASGQLGGPLDIARLRWQTPDLQIDIKQLRLDWSPGALFDKRLQIGELVIGELQIISAPSSEPSPAPTDLQLPLAVNVEKLAISRLSYGNALSASRLSAQLSSDGRQHRLANFSAELADIGIHGEVRLGCAAPLPLEANVTLNGLLAEQALAVEIAAQGTLEKIRLSAIARQGMVGQAEAIITPFAPAAFEKAEITLDDIDPAAWQKGAPSARLGLRLNLGPQGDGIAGNFSVENTLPGPIDKQRLPLEKLTGKVDWQGETTRLEQLAIRLSGEGTLNGRGQWQTETLTLDLQASQLNAARLATTLRPTSLNGPLTAEIAANRQALKLDLRDARFSLRGEVEHAGEQISVAALELAAGNARLSAKGKLSLNEALTFDAEGELAHFDPSRFAKVPSAEINARLKAGGKLAPRPVIDATFELRDSQLAGQPLAGHGTLQADWPRIPQADIQLAFGPNQLALRGAYGRPSDVLSLRIDAPQLAPYGIDGDLSGQAELAGSIDKPSLKAELRSSKLGKHDVGQLLGLKLKAAIGSEASSPARIDLTIERIDTPEQPAQAKALTLAVDGSKQAHRLLAQTTLPGNTAFRLAAEGGLLGNADHLAWQGRLLELLLKSEDKARTIQLSAPSPLRLAADAWSIGPARLAGESLPWKASLTAQADTKNLLVSASGEGPRLGRIESELRAGMQGAWSLNSLTPWQGNLKSETGDLAWLGELIGAGLRTEGSLNGQLQLAGTPAQPLASGRLRGHKLGLAMSDQGLNLLNGELAVDLDNNLLRITTLGFDSLLKPLPRALRLNARTELATLTEKPGRIDISGEMRVDRNKGADQAFIDIQLDRLGIWQLPEQWVAVSGNGRLKWQEGSFGILGKLAVDAGYWQLSQRGGPTLSDDVVIKRPGAAKKDNTLRPSMELDLTADLGKNFLFKGAGVSSRLVGDIRLTASGRDLPRASGSIRTRDGRFDAYGQQLEIERGILTFQGLLNNPALDVRAVRKGLSVEPGVQIAGTAQKPNIKLISDPDLPEAEKLAWLILGHGPEQMSAGDATVLLGAAGGLLGNNSGNVVQELKQTFGVDEFGIRQGDIGGTGGPRPGSRVAGGSSTNGAAATGNQIFSVGKRLSPNALISYEQSLSSAESIVKLTVNLTRQISFIGRAGSDNALDVFYTISFGKPPKKPR